MTYSQDQLARDGIDQVTITPRDGGYGESPTFEVYGHGEYGEFSVLAGQYRRVFLAGYSTLEQAQADYPFAEVLGGLMPASWIAPRLPDSPPDWFDPSDAGESWNEV
jgi:hypothetical protein